MRKALILLFIATLVIVVSGCGLVSRVVPHEPTQEDMLYGVFYDRTNLEYAKELIDAGEIDVNGRTSLGGYVNSEYSLIGLVIYEGNNKFYLEYLLENGADPDVAYGDKTPLMCILGGGEDEMNSRDIEIIKLLLKYGADVNATDKAGMTALDYAMSDNIEVPIIEMLLASGAAVSNKTLTIAQRDINCESSYRATRLMFEAAEKQGVEYKDELFKSVVLGKTEDALRLLKASEGHAENLPFYAAAYCGVELFAELVSQGFDAETQDSKDCDSLQIAAAAGNLEIVKYLVENGASLDFSDYRYIDYDPLKASIINDHYDVTKYLLEKGAKFNINKEVGFDGERYYPMDRPSDSIQGAVINGNQEMLTLMWEHGYPNDDNTDARGLESAIYYDKPDMLEYFLEKGADPNPDESLLTVEDSMVDACASFGTIHLLKILDKHGSNMNLSNTHALISAVFSFNVEIVKYLLSEKMPVDTVYTYEDGSHGDTAWHEATRHGYFEIIKLLVEHGADVNDEQTDYIVENGGESHNILKYLIDNGADVNRQDKEGNTALMMAAKYNRAENAKLLLKSGADTKLKNDEGKTALDIAKDSGAKDVEKIIKGA